LENSYLTKRAREGRRDDENGDSADGGMDAGKIWIDFNSLDTEGCWVMGGPNATCPYTNGMGFEDEMTRRVILVRLPHPFLFLFLDLPPHYLDNPIDK
jgi:hypothetical protein